MISRLALTTAARADVHETVHWYEGQQSGLGTRFLNEFEHLLDRIAVSPRQFPEIEGPIRRGLLRRFPYGVYFVATVDRIDVIAVLHLHRNPRDWKRRT